ncbi:MAG: ArsC/Spx/MgsR family protein [Rikenellaceae bacterium]|nr:ArsC/Spx/MgsR family protein [Rikenellaceae bacterium]
MKEKMETATREELLSVLASDGKLVKRPLLVAADFVLVGFDETAWRQRLAVR